MIRMGVLGPSDIARRRMVPAIGKAEKITYAGVAIADREEWGENISAEEYAEMWSRKKEKARGFTEQFGGELFEGYETLLHSDKIDAVYIPLPPSLHFKWAKKALECGKHVLLEKPFTIRYQDTKELVRLAKEKHLAIFENYGFIYHKQMAAMKQALYDGELGELRHIRAAFSFPYRGRNDFRYSAALGGGALWDCGGYTVKAAEAFMEGELRVLAKKLNYLPDHDVDMYGSVTLEDANGCNAQLFFGMDNAYICNLELWGSKGMISTPRAFTAPDTLEVPVTLRTAAGEKTINIPPEDQFLAALNVFYEAVQDMRKANNIQKEILMHGKLINEIKE